MAKLYYDYRDIFKAPRIALMGKNIFIMMLNLCLGYFLYLVFTYGAFLIDGYSIPQVWSLHQLFPLGKDVFEGNIALAVWAVGILLLLYFFLRGALGGARASFKALRGIYFYSSREAMKFISGKIVIVFRAILGVVVFMAFIILLGIIVGLIGKIPYVGELIYGFFYDFPFFVVSLFAVLVIFLLSTFILLGPAVTAVKGEDAMTALFDSFAAVTTQPLRWSLYTAGSLVLAKISVFVLTYFSIRAIQFTNWSTKLAMGDKQAELFSSAAREFFIHCPFITFFTILLPGISIDANKLLDVGYASDLNWSMTAGSVFVMISLVFILFFIASYFINILISGQVIGFLDIRNATHNEKLAVLPEDEITDEMRPEKETGDDDKPA